MPCPQRYASSSARGPGHTAPFASCYRLGPGLPSWQPAYCCAVRPFNTRPKRCFGPSPMPPSEPAKGALGIKMQPKAPLPAPEIAFKDLGLSDPILKALTDVGYETPSPIQARTIPHIFGNCSCVALPPTSL